MSCPEIVIPNVTAALYGKLVGTATLAGVDFTTSHAAFKGLEFDWRYDAEAQTLHVTCIKKPFYVGCGMVEDKIRELLKGATDAK